MSHLAADTKKPAVEIGFEYALSFHGETMIYMARLPDGKICCSVLSRPELGDGASERKWKKIKELSLSRDDFARIESEFDPPMLRRAAERDWPPTPDGARWLLRKKTGSLVNAYPGVSIKSLTQFPLSKSCPYCFRAQAGGVR